MSLRMIEAIKRLPVTPTQKLVLFCLADCHNGETERCDPTIATIMQVSGLSNRAVSTAVQDLQTKGVLTIKTMAGHRSSYSFNTDQPPQEVHDTPAGGSLSTMATPAANAGESRSKCGGVPQEVHDTPAGGSHKPEVTGTEPEVTGKPEGAGEPPPVVVKAKAQKPDWRDWNRGLAESANAVELPTESTEDFRVAWKRWCDYRTAKAVEARISSEAVEWTVAAAESGIRDCQRAAKTFGWPEVLGRMDQAQAGGWRGFNFDRMTPPRSSGFNGSRTPRNPAYNAATATAGMTPDQILKF